MGCSDESFASARERVRLALSAMGGGNPAPYVRCWADSEDATLFGAWGPVERGFPRLAETAGASKDDAVLIVAGNSKTVAASLGALRNEVARREKLIPADTDWW